MNYNVKKGLIAVGLLVVAGSASAAVDPAVATQVTTITGYSDDLNAIGGALLGLSVVSASWMWIKHMVGR